MFGATTQGGAVIEGTVIDTRNGKGLPGVSVELTLAPRPPGDVTRAVTDAAGRFMLIGLSRGRYRLTASKTGYANADIEDPLRSTGAIIAVASDQRIEDVRVPLVPTSALSGRVIDQQGQAMSGVRVILLQPSYSRMGRSYFNPSVGHSPMTAETIVCPTWFPADITCWQLVQPNSQWSPLTTLAYRRRTLPCP